MALSYRGLWFGPGDAIEAQASMWLDRIRESRRQALLVDYYKEIRFEDLLADHRSVLRDVCSYIDLNYDPVMEYYYKSAGERLKELADYVNSDGSIRISRER